MPNILYLFFLYHTASLQISDAEEEDQGNYECMAENIHGSALSVMATLFVRGKLYYGANCDS